MILRNGYSIVEECPAARIEIFAHRGKFVEGLVSPAIAGLTIKVLHGDTLQAEGETNQDGKYRYFFLLAQLHILLNSPKPYLA